MAPSLNARSSLKGLVRPLIREFVSASVRRRNGHP
jgi:hypothetical protein